MREACGGEDWRDDEEEANIEGEETRHVVLYRAFSVWRNEDVPPGPVAGSDLAGACSVGEKTTRARLDTSAETGILKSVLPAFSVLGKGQGGDPSDIQPETVEITSTVFASCPSPPIEKATKSEPLTSLVPASLVFGIGKGHGASPSQYHITVLTSKPPLPIL